MRKLGPVVAGLVLSGQQTSGAAPGTTYVTPCVLPSDATTLFTLWDPATNPLPPAPTTYGPVDYLYGAGVPYPVLPVSGSINLPQPVDAQAGVSLGVGIWMLPSLMTSGEPPPAPGSAFPALALAVFFAAYTVVFDDGQ